MKLKVYVQIRLNDISLFTIKRVDELQNSNLKKIKINLRI